MLLGSNQHLVSQFQDITTVGFRSAAEHVLKINQWNLSNAVQWFHEHRHDVDDPYLKLCLKTADEINQEKIGLLLTISLRKYLYVNMFVKKVLCYCKIVIILYCNINL